MKPYYDKVLVLEIGKNKKSAQTMQAQNRFFPQKRKQDLEVTLKMIEINPNLQQGFSFGGWLPKIIPELQANFKPPYEDNSNSPQSDEFFQFQAFLAGMENASIANPNPSVGCIIVKNNRIIASGCTQAWKGVHAEQEAFNKLQGQSLEGAHVYLTLEPCTHFGNQPPCIDLFRNKGISKIVIARPDLNPEVNNKGIGTLIEMGIDVRIGLLAKEVTAWNYPFFIQQKNNRPLIALKWAQSLDGCLADDSNGSQWISGPLSRKYAHWLRQKYDAVLVGGATFLTDAPSLDVRDIEHFPKRNPLRMVFDPKARIFFCTKDEQIILKKKSFTKNIKTLFLIDQNMIREVLSSSSEWCRELRASANIKILPIKSELGFYSAKDVLESVKHPEFIEFFERPLQSIFVEGGPCLLSMFIQDELFDVAHVFTAPFVLGGVRNKLFAQSNEVFKKSHPREILTVKRWQLIAQERLGNDTLMEMVPDSRFADILY